MVNITYLQGFIHLRRLFGISSIKHISSWHTTQQIIFSVRRFLRKQSLTLPETNIAPPNWWFQAIYSDAKVTPTGNLVRVLAILAQATFLHQPWLKSSAWYTRERHGLLRRRSASTPGCRGTCSCSLRAPPVLDGYRDDGSRRSGNHLRNQFADSRW